MTCLAVALLLLRQVTNASSRACLLGSRSNPNHETFPEMRPSQIFRPGAAHRQHSTHTPHPATLERSRELPRMCGTRACLSVLQDSQFSRQLRDLCRSVGSTEIPAQHERLKPSMPSTAIRLIGSRPWVHNRYVIDRPNVTMRPLRMRSPGGMRFWSTNFVCWERIREPFVQVLVRLHVLGRDSCPLVCFRHIHESLFLLAELLSFCAANHLLRDVMMA